MSGGGQCQNKKKKTGLAVGVRWREHDDEVSSTLLPVIGQRASLKGSSEERPKWNLWSHDRTILGRTVYTLVKFLLAFTGFF